MRCRVFVATAVVCVFLVGSAHAAGAQDGGNQERDRRISVTGGLVVARGETVDGPAVSANGPVRIDGRVNGAVYVGRGDLRIDGRVTGDVLVLDGDASIGGRVGGSVTLLNGKATVRPGADVQGDVASRTAPTAARGTVGGHVQKLDINSLFAGFVVVILAMLWVAVTLSTALLGLLFVWLFPRAADAVVVAGRRVWASFFVGLFVWVIALAFGLAIMASVVGIPLGFAVLGTLAVLTPLGYVAGALVFGRLMVHRSGTGGRIGAFFAGFGILRFGALVPGLGLVIWFFFATYGFGAVIIAAWRAGRRAFGVDELHPEYASVPLSAYEAEAWPPYFPVPEPRRRRSPARATRAGKSGARRKTTKKSTKKTTKKARKPAKRAAKKTTKRTTRKPAKRAAKKTTKRTTPIPAKRTSKKTTAKKSTKKARKPAKRSTTTITNGRASTAKRASSNSSRATKQPRKRKSPARKTSTNRSRVRARA